MGKQKSLRNATAYAYEALDYFERRRIVVPACLLLITGGRDSTYVELHFITASREAPELLAAIEGASPALRRDGFYVHCCAVTDPKMKELLEENDVGLYGFKLKASPIVVNIPHEGGNPILSNVEDITVLRWLGYEMVMAEVSKP